MKNRIILIGISDLLVTRLMLAYYTGIDLELAVAHSLLISEEKHDEHLPCHLTK